MGTKTTKDQPDQPDQDPSGQQDPTPDQSGQPDQDQPDQEKPDKPTGQAAEQRRLAEQQSQDREADQGRTGKDDPKQGQKGGGSR